MDLPYDNHQGRQNKCKDLEQQGLQMHYKNVKKFKRRFLVHQARMLVVKFFSTTGNRMVLLLDMNKRGSDAAISVLSEHCKEVFKV